MIERRFAEGKFDRLPALAAELVTLKPEVMSAGGSNAALAASKATKTIPIVFVAVSDPVGSGRRRLRASAFRRRCSCAPTEYRVNDGSRASRRQVRDVVISGGVVVEAMQRCRKFALRLDPGPVMQ